MGKNVTEIGHWAVWSDSLLSPMVVIFNQIFRSVFRPTINNLDGRLLWRGEVSVDRLSIPDEYNVVKTVRIELTKVTERYNCVFVSAILD